MYERRPIGRLAAVSWGERPPASPADQLGVLVSRLRRTLGAERIQRESDGYRFTPDWLDLTEFHQRASEAEARLTRGTAGAALASAQAALQLGDETGEWAESERRAVTAGVEPWMEPYRPTAPPDTFTWSTLGGHPNSSTGVYLLVIVHYRPIEPRCRARVSSQAPRVRHRAFPARGQVSAGRAGTVNW